ncbi:UNVERIFIED_CONTAM: putative mitochondrial protein [Sesamum calycinum]|uniref:Mitochondrial protein n=1 Tax=Sesamum calycinum TaxID=2727403 RepID=A0AAW2JHM6_9LAMI
MSYRKLIAVAGNYRMVLGTVLHETMLCCGPGKYSSRRRVNAIDRLRDEGGRWIDDPAALRRLIERHFSRVFNSDQPSTTEIERGMEHLACRIEALAQLFTKEEVVRALFQMAPMKSPGPDGGLGFREFRAFNQAMLAKQCWRVFTNPHSLLGRLLKARYFPHSSFLDAPLLETISDLEKPVVCEASDAGRNSVGGMARAALLRCGLLLGYRDLPPFVRSRQWLQMIQTSLFLL